MRQPKRKKQSVGAVASEPPLLILNVGSHKLFIGFCQIDNAFDEADDVSETTGKKSDHDFDNSFSSVAEDEFVNSKPTDQDSAKARSEFLICAHRLPIGYGALINGLHRLVTTAAQRTQRGLTIRTVLGQVVVLGATFCAISHLY